MEDALRAYVVDDVMARLDGEVAPIWITVALRVEGSPPRERWVEGLRALVAATPRLRMRWDGAGWSPCARPDAVIEAAVTQQEALAERMAEVVEACAARPSQLDHALPLRLHLAPMPGDTTLLVFTLHHAVGDARALGATLARWWPWFHGDPIAPDPAPVQTCRDADLLKYLMGSPWQAVGAFDPSRFLLSKRALALPRDGDVSGPSQLAPLVFEGAPDAKVAAACFNAALLATTARHVPDGPGAIRWRTPWDMREALQIEGALCNACCAVPLEFERDVVLNTPQEVEALWQLVRDQYRRIARLGVTRAAMLECLLVARLVKTPALRAGARPGLIAATRTNTQVVTFVGELTPFIQEAPLRVVGACGQTPTWGANAWTLRGRLVVNLTAFEGIWSRERLGAFAEELAQWLERRAGLRRVDVDDLWRVA